MFRVHTIFCLPYREDRSDVEVVEIELYTIHPRR